MDTTTTTTPTGDEISETVQSQTEFKLPFGKRLRMKLESLHEGEEFTIRTKNERQHVTNVVGMVQRKTGRKFSTNQVRRRSEDPDGKITLTIKRLVVDD